jgi:hypothetical protein
MAEIDLDTLSTPEHGYTVDDIGRSVASALTAKIPDMHSFTWTARAA